MKNVTCDGVAKKRLKHSGTALIVRSTKAKAEQSARSICEWAVYGFHTPKDVQVHIVLTPIGYSVFFSGNVCAWL